jgi:hypothetical protein
MGSFSEKLTFQKGFTVPDWSTVDPDIPAASLLQRNLQIYTVPWDIWRVHDAYQTLLPGTSATDDLGLIGGTFGTDSPSIQTYDVKAAGAQSLYARGAIVLPPNYVAGQTVELRCHAGMLTTVADNSCTLDVEAYESDEEAGISADLCATAAENINNLTLADKDFTITASGLEAGSLLDVRLTVAVNDASSGTVVKAIIGAVKLLCDTQGG